jgi:beta-lactamase superfamily II metal-dependent hydrolase
MKKIALLLVTLLFVLASVAQKQLHIHHINIENGDATLIGIYDVATQKYISKILIDGGQSSATDMLLPYIKKMVGTDKESFHFNYVILTHYHNDHYTGLLAIKTGAITADSVIDPGGYRVDSIFKSGSHASARPANLNRAMQWLNALSTAAHHTPVPYVKGRSTVILSFGTNSQTGIGNKFTIGELGANKVELQCIAGWGNTISNNGIVPNPDPDLDNANNYTLAFILTCGEFRYFIGGDMGGQNTSEYIDQETAVTAYLDARYPVSFSSDSSTQAKGHICGFKANHHGSNNSNDSAFIGGMHPAISITSAGDNDNWHLPNPVFLQRLAAVKPLSQSTSNPVGTFNRGIYFTNLYNFTEGASKTKANSLFRNKPGISYDYGNNTTHAKGSYLIKLTDEDALGEKSVFEVGRVDITKKIPYKKLAFFFCHRK